MENDGAGPRITRMTRISRPILSGECWGLRHSATATIELSVAESPGAITSPGIVPRVPGPL